MGENMGENVDSMGPGDMCNGHMSAGYVGNTCCGANGVGPAEHVDDMDPGDVGICCHMRVGDVRLLLAVTLSIAGVAGSDLVSRTASELDGAAPYTNSPDRELFIPVVGCSQVW
jgi:hypothetical protein